MPTKIRHIDKVHSKYQVDGTRLPKQKKAE